MALTTKVKDTSFGVGDTVRVKLTIKEGEKSRIQTFEGMVIGIKGHGAGKSFTVRRIGTAQIGIERIFPVNAPVIDSVEVVREGTKGVKRSKLYYTREKHKREIEQIYSRAAKKTTKKKKESKK